MKKLMLIISILILPVLLMSSPASAKPTMSPETSEGGYSYEVAEFINGCYYDLGTVWVEFTGECYWICNEFTDGSVNQSSIINGEADIYHYDGTLTLLEENIPFSISETFTDLDGTKTVKTPEEYYDIIVQWHELDEYSYQREIEGRFEEGYRLKKNGKWSWWYKAGKCHDRANSNNY